MEPDLGRKGTGTPDAGWRRTRSLVCPVSYEIFSQFQPAPCMRTEARLPEGRFQEESGGVALCCKRRKVRFCAHSPMTATTTCVRPLCTRRLPSEAGEG